MVDSTQGRRTQCLRTFQRPFHPMGINPVSLPSRANSTQVPLTTLTCHSLKLWQFCLFAENYLLITADKYYLPVNNIIPLKTALTIETLYGEHEKETKPQNAVSLPKFQSDEFRILLFQGLGAFTIFWRAYPKPSVASKSLVLWLGKRKQSLSGGRLALSLNFEPQSQDPSY